jgi:hypothetical protein
MVEKEHTPSEPERIAKAISALSEMEYTRLVDFFQKAAPPPTCHCSCTSGAAAGAKPL